MEARRLMWGRRDRRRGPATRLVPASAARARRRLLVTTVCSPGGAPRFGSHWARGSAAPLRAVDAGRRAATGGAAAAETQRGPAPIFSARAAPAARATARARSPRAGCRRGTGTWPSASAGRPYGHVESPARPRGASTGGGRAGIGARHLIRAAHKRVRRSSARTVRLQCGWQA
eukprot:3945912-Prymnesium_polylepis.1